MQLWMWEMKKYDQKNSLLIGRFHGVDVRIIHVAKTLKSHVGFYLGPMGFDLGPMGFHLGPVAFT